MTAALFHDVSRSAAESWAPGICLTSSRNCVFFASHAESGPAPSRRLADDRFHDAVRELIEGWDRPVTEDEAELEYQETLDHLPAPLVPDSYFA